MNTPTPALVAWADQTLAATSELLDELVRKARLDLDKAVGGPLTAESLLMAGIAVLLIYRFGLAEGQRAVAGLFALALLRLARTGAAGAGVPAAPAVAGPVEETPGPAPCPDGGTS